MTILLWGYRLTDLFERLSRSDWETRWNNLREILQTICQIFSL